MFGRISGRPAGRSSCVPTANIENIIMSLLLVDGSFVIVPLLLLVVVAVVFLVGSKSFHHRIANVLMLPTNVVCTRNMNYFGYHNRGKKHAGGARSKLLQSPFCLLKTFSQMLFRPDIVGSNARGV